MSERDPFDSPLVDQERMAKWRENALSVKLPEGFNKPLKAKECEDAPSNPTPRLADASE
jgi:hypothetical protein